MRRPVPPPAPPPGLLRRLDSPLLSLHAALDVDSLWEAFLEVIRAAIPAHRVTLFLGHLGMGEARVVRTDPPIIRPTEWYAERGRINPFIPYIEANRGIRHYRFEDVLPPTREWKNSDFYQRFASVEGWDKGYSMLFWANREVTGMFSLYRAPEEPRFSKAEERILAWLYPYIGIAIARVQRLHSERLARRSLEEFNRHIPVGLILISWDLKVEFANLEAQRQALAWNFSESEARALSPKDAFSIPGPVLAACARLKATVQGRDPKSLTLLPGDVEGASHAERPELRAMVSLHNNPGNALAKPRFLAVLDTRPQAASTQASPAVSNPEHFGALRELTPREREIALLVCEGCSNAEIAKRLSKSVLTIKTQLNSVFRKLGVRSRTRLMALMR
ncbi:LuxR C-terminal-related transcriptional regulator [Nibricoccus sp. IMCC34717]|uniref:helix-turn-helix transcriptional regulator n=1 Tax=Nibricoccus sp. IMCC34717 TaxID=3034021 RepID=UPI00384CB434